MFFDDLTKTAAGAGYSLRPLASGPDDRVHFIQAAGFDVIPAPSADFPNHFRLIHPNGAAGFSDANLQELSKFFTNTAVP